MKKMIRTGIASFDSIAGGLVPGGNHLLYGELGTSKSTFALQFLYSGLSQGESAALVTRRFGEDVLHHAEAFGFPLRAFVQSGKLLLLEYAPDVVERAARVKDVSQIADEFQHFARRKVVRRIVFDPLSPIVQGMNSSEVSFRMRSLIQRFSEYQATALYTLDLPEAADILGSCKDVMQAILRFEVASESAVQVDLIVERMPGASSGHRRISYCLAPGRGIVEASPNGVSSAESPKRKILVAATDPLTLGIIRKMVADEYELTECQDTLQAVARLAAESHDMLIVDADLEDNNAVRACLELRKNQFHLPMLLLVTGQQKRLHDRLGLLAQGIDDCLEKPVDGRLLRVRVRSLLKRYSSRERFRDQESDNTVLASLKRFSHNGEFLTDSEVFRTCLEEEVGHAQQFSVPLSVCIIDLPDSNGGGLNKANTVQSLVRPEDKVYANAHVIAVLLSETSKGGAATFLRRLEAIIRPPAIRQVRTLTFDGSTDFVSQVFEHLSLETNRANEIESRIKAT